MSEIRNFTLNVGPAHPAAQGALRLVLEMNGEVIELTRALVTWTGWTMCR